MKRGSDVERALDRYNDKRDFDVTNEPKGRARREADEHSFVVQKHAARRLHYDFRLELDGVLKSWAVPKGPSLSPKDKRLAVQTEDHPIDYRDFEGTIPEGQYGAGAVIVWDRGRWEPIGDPHEGLRKGHLEFRLEGDKLEGRYTLVRLAGKRAEDERSGKSNWLLIKRSDEHVREGSDADVVRRAPRSLLTGRTIEDVKAGAPPPLAEPAALETTNRRKRAATKADPLPEFGTIAPALATLVEDVPTGPTSDAWVFEIKYDGYRALTTLDEGRVRIASRRGNDWTARFPEIARAIATVRARTAIFDGEIAYVDANGRTDFQHLQNAIGGRPEDRAKLTYFVFDLLYYDGRDLRSEPLTARKDYLRTILAGEGPPLHFGEHFIGDGAAFLREARDLGLEGIVAKRADRPYPSGRGRDWLKVKCAERQEFVIAGFTPPKGERKGIGALLLSIREGRGYRYVGKVGTGFSHKTLRELDARLRALVDGAKPPKDAPKVRGDVWVRPELVCEVRFSEWTHDGILRQSTFEGLREDKKPEEVVRERAASARFVRASPRAARHSRAAEAAMARAAASPTARAVAPAAPSRAATAGTRAASSGTNPRVLGVRITHPNRVVDTSTGLTKLDLVRYHEAVAKELVAWARRRPLLLVRCTSAWTAETLAIPAAARPKPCFVQRHGGRGLVGAGVGHARVGKEPVLFVTKPSDVIGLAQFNAIEFHGWGARLPKIDTPDWIVFDLDPDEGLPFSAVVDAAFEVRESLAQIGLLAFVKTTGGKGLHVTVPLRPRDANDDWDTVRAFAAWVAETFAAQAPSRYVATMSKAKRTGKVFIDHFRNASRATAILPYSPRAKPGAPIAMPVAWDDLRHVDPGEFTVRTVPGIVATRRDDPWAEMKNCRQVLPASVKRLLDADGRVHAASARTRSRRSDH